MKTALIAALAVIAASAIGGFAQWKATTSAISTEIRRDRDHEAVQASGAARVLISELFTTANYMLMLSGDRLYRPLDPKYQIEVPPEDMRLIFTYLTANEWGEVIIALNNIQGLETFVRSKISDGERRLDRQAVRLALGDFRSVMSAAETLKRVAAAEDIQIPVEFVTGE